MTYSVGQRLVGGRARLRAAETTPPRRYSDGTLITAMTNIHRFVTNEADRRILRDTKGIGTDRTRDAIIETLKARGYLKAVKGELHPTEAGIELIEKLPPELRDPVTTAKWEMALGLIAEGKMPPASFDDMIRKMCCALVEGMKSVKFDLSKMGAQQEVDAKPRSEIDHTLPGHGQPCPKCREGTMTGRRLASGKRLVSCSAYPACKHTSWID
ncbi:DNA topoisomerase [Cupriavidus nantongensis]|nr:DNA topoisomerase [Cupriavidus nantongensis]